MHTITLEKGLATFLNALSGKNRSAATIRAYQTDIQQFIAFLHANNVSIQTPADVEKVDVVEHLSSLAKRELTGIARARKMGFQALSASCHPGDFKARGGGVR
jgi:site-specific recombinase XerD